MKFPLVGFERGGIARAVLSSAIATVTDYLLFAALVGAGAVAAMATLLGCVVGGCVNFAANRYWAFAGRDSLLRSALRYATVSGTSALANSLLVGVATSGFGLSARPAWAAARGLVFVGLTYPLFRGWVFGVREQGLPTTATIRAAKQSLDVVVDPQLS